MAKGDNTWCRKCEDYTPHITVDIEYTQYRDLGDGSISDYRTVQCKVCGNKDRYDFAPDRR